MILIVCDAYEPSVDDVTDWLKHKGFNFLRINTNDLIDSLEIEISGDAGNRTSINCSGETIEFSKITSYWYKRGMLKVRHESLTKRENNFAAIINDQVSWELYGVEHYLNAKLKGIPHIGSFF
ncbi:MAG: hypothetical protein ACHQRM_13765, partial [Bacteroidia bacterium]